MTEKAFRLDFFIAIAALVMSAVTAIAMIYQTAVMRDQYAASIWPYLTVSTTTDSSPSTRRIALTNDGLGPALVRSAQLTVDDKPYATWNDYIHLLERDPLYRRAKHGEHFKSVLSDVDQTTIVRAGDTMPILQETLPQSVPQALILKHRVTLDVCYCSLNGNCWTTHAVAGKSGTLAQSATAQCTIGPTIKSYVE